MSKTTDDIVGPQTAQAVRDVLVERRAQIERGFVPEHDDAKEADGQMAAAAACYALGNRHSVWTWAEHWWKPTTRRRNLVKAGALILAEIERLDRSDAR